MAGIGQGAPIDSVVNRSGHSIRRWWNAVRSLAPSRLWPAWGAEPKVLTVTSNGATFTVSETRLAWIGRGRPRVALETADWSQARDLVRRRKRRWGPLLTVELSLADQAILQRRRNLPEHAQARAAEILSLDVERTTPFRRNDVVAAHYVSGPGSEPRTVEVVHVLAKRELVEPLIADLASDGIEVTAIRACAGGSALPVELLSGNFGQRWTLTNRVAAATALLAVIAAATGLLAVGIEAWRRQEQLETLIAANARARTQAVTVRSALSQAEDLRKAVGRLELRKASTPSMLQLWEEMTKIVPDGAWVLDLRVEGGNVQIDGYASSAAALLRLVSESPLFEAADFTAPVTRESQIGKERFQLSARIAAPAGVNATAKDAGAREPKK